MPEPAMPEPAMPESARPEPARPEPAMPDPAGPGATRCPPVVPGYTLDVLLGRGGSGEVWRAVPRAGGVPVAIKVLVQGEPERQAREAALLGELDHPHLVRLIEVVHQPRRGGVARVALVLELLAGGSLAALLARRGRLRPGEVVTAIAPVAAALAYAHEHGVVHGDLSPGNIVFTAEGRPVLTDLGVARVVGEEAAAEVTPPYVDPTVACGGAPGPASDIFGVAAAAFHALTGIAPWNAATPADTLAVAATGLLPDLDELAPDAPAELRAVIRRGLAADPHDRGSAAAFALDLRHAVRPEPVRLPALGVPDGDLGRTGHGPRTELTHQVPGRRRSQEPSPANRARGRHLRAPLRSRRTRIRPLAAVVLVSLGLLVAGWAGTHWGSAEPPLATQAEVAAVAPGAAGARPGGGGDGNPDPVTTSGPAPDPTVVPPSPAPGPATNDTTAAADEQLTGTDWAGVVADLYRSRGRAFADRAPAGLDAVYTAASPLRAGDAEHLRQLAVAGEALRGFTPEVVAITAVEQVGPVVQVRLIDRWPPYDVVAVDAPQGSALRTEDARVASAAVVELERTAQGWRIASAARVG